MKPKSLLVVVAVFLVACAYWFQHLNAAPAPETEIIQIDKAPSADLPPVASTELARIAVAPEELVAQQEAVAQPGRAAEVRGLSGRVVDSGGRGIEGATVYLVDLTKSDLGEAVGLPRTITNGRGEFMLNGFKRWVSSHPGDVHLRAVANGFLRSGSTQVAEPYSMEGLELTLRRGLSIDGRVSDEDGLPVGGLPLLIHSPFVGDDSVSLSRVAASAALRNLAPLGDWPHYQCEAVTARNGAVAFQGLEDGDYLLRSLDPSWEVMDPREARAGMTGVQWVAVRRFSVRLAAIVRGQPLGDGFAYLDRPVLRAAFRVRLQLENGTEVDTGQWLGRGLGEATLALTPDLVPDVALGEVAEIQFYGTAKLDGEEVEWQSPKMNRSVLRRGKGITATAEFRGRRRRDSSLSKEGLAVAPKEDQPSSVAVEIDVRYRGSAAPFVGNLSVDWAAKTVEGRSLTGDSRGKLLSAGRYQAYLPVGEVSLALMDASASGSLPKWMGRVTVKKEGTETIQAELMEGAAVDIQRPMGWQGQWFLHASYRESAEDPWFGSWNYSAPTDTLRLTSLQPAEWRFRLRREPRGEPLETRFVKLVSGDDVRVE